MKRFSIVLLLVLLGCGKDKIVVPPPPPPTTTTTSSQDGERPRQPAYVRIDRIIPEPGTIIERSGTLAKTYNLTVNFTTYYDSDEFKEVSLFAYSEAPQAGLRQPVLYRSNNPTSRGVIPRQVTSGSFVGDFSVGSWSTSSANPTGAQPTRLVVQLLLGRSFAGIISITASAEQVYTVR